MRLRYESESGVQLDDPSAGELDALLARLDGVDDSYASLTAADGSGYVQAGGGPTEFTVELRETRPDGTFRHLKAARPDGGAAERQLAIGGGDVTVRADEVLDRAAVGQVFRAFLSGRVVAAPVLWHDVTAMFAGTS